MSCIQREQKQLLDKLFDLLQHVEFDCTSEYPDKYTNSQQSLQFLQTNNFNYYEQNMKHTSEKAHRHHLEVDRVLGKPFDSDPLASSSALQVAYSRIPTLPPLDSIFETCHLSDGPNYQVLRFSSSLLPTEQMASWQSRRKTHLQLQSAHRWLLMKFWWRQKP